ncbi:MAG: bifunctional metallophosphatase/5'-nucleotidase, partial [Myxococcota bacterium]
MKSTMRLGLVPVLATLMVGCPDNDDDKEDTGPVDTGLVEPETGDRDTGEPPVAAAFTLQLLHFADVDSNEATALSNIPDFSALVDGFSNDATYGDVSILVSSGDNVIPGPRWFAAENSSVRSISGSNEPGHADHYIMNQLGVVASVIGNHELDQGPGEFADAIQAESGGGADFPGAQFPYLAANIDFSAEDDLTVGDAGAEASTLAAQVAPSATVVVNGETIGLVGVSTPQLPSITTTGDLVIDGNLDPISDLADSVQPAIDALASSGIDKIIVLADLQNLNNEKALAGELENVDIIVGGGSNTRMGDSND